MAQTQVLKRRLRSVGNTKQITKAMELVSAAKMRKVVAVAASSRIYSDAAISILNRLVNSVEAKHNPYFVPSTIHHKLYIIFTSDGGLAGAYNSNIFNLANKSFREDIAKGKKPLVIAIGRKGAHHFSHSSAIEMIGEYEGFADFPDINVFAPILEVIKDGIIEGKFSSVDLIFTEFISSLNQRPRSLRLIPVEPPVEEVETKQDKLVFDFEPNAEVVLQEALRVYFESSLRRARIEAAASEHAMRMMSMNNAQHNASDLIDSLRLELNATRQAAITQEMAEIIGGADAIS